jgi:hypothetical protein
MGWPFLWPAEEPWPVCRQRNPELASRLEEGLERAEARGRGSDRDTLRHPTPREIITLLIERNRNGHNAAYLPVLQLSRPEFPELPFPADSDLFQLLWCPDVHFEGSGGYLIFWRRAEAITKLRVQPPPAGMEGYWITTSTLDPERIEDYPGWFEVASPLLTSPDSEEDWWRTMEDSGPAPGTKLLGFPKWIQGPDYPPCRGCQVPMDLLVTISSTEFGHGGNDDMRWVPSEDRDNLGNAPFSLREEYELPHGWMIGDGGDAYLFCCRNCHAEFDSRVQSS